MKYTLETERDRAEGLDAAVDIWRVMQRINRRDTRMAFEFSRLHGADDRCPDPASVYANLKAAMQAVLRALGVKDMDGAWMSLLDGAQVLDVVNTYANEGS
jgi:hypothetical protein